jgi:enterochelin esterase-like enzyme
MFFPYKTPVVMTPNINTTTLTNSYFEHTNIPHIMDNAMKNCMISRRIDIFFDSGEDLKIKKKLFMINLVIDISA